MSKTSSKVKNRWNSEHYTRITLFLSKPDAERYRAKCEEQGITLSEVPKRAILDFINEGEK